jgi:branched-chain amino acid transport system ATP-binding protein
MLVVEHLQSAYGPAQVLFDVGFRVGAGEVVTLLGRNGMGKTTTIHTLMGMLPACGGTAVFEDVPLLGLPPYRIAQAGLGLVPEGRQIFPTLTVRENLVATAANRLGASDPWTVDRVFELFPQLARRRDVRGDHLSGGEQQMLAIGRALMRNPAILLLDEPSEGLAPKLVEEVGAALLRLRASGLAILLVEQNLALATSIGERVLVMNKGTMVFAGTPAELVAAREVEARFLGI